MRKKLIRTSLLYSFLLVFALNALGTIFEGTILNFLALPSMLMAPGIWIVYGLFDVNNHDLLPFVLAELIDLLIYWLVFMMLLGAWWGRRDGNFPKPRQP